MKFICAEKEVTGNYLNFYIEKKIPILSVRIEPEDIDFFCCNYDFDMENSPFKVPLLEFVCTFSEAERALILKKINDKDEFHRKFYVVYHHYLKNNLETIENMLIKEITSIFE